MILILVLFIVSLAGLFAVLSDKEQGDAYIYVKGSLYGKYDLSEPTLIHIDGDNGLENDIEISGGKIFMKNANCPGRQCIKCGSISRNNESICCAPAGILIIVRSQKEAEYDAVTK